MEARWYSAEALHDLRAMKTPLPTWKTRQQALYPKNLRTATVREGEGRPRIDVYFDARAAADILGVTLEQLPQTGAQAGYGPLRLADKARDLIELVDGVVKYRVGRLLELYPEVAWADLADIEPATSASQEDAVELLVAAGLFDWVENNFDPLP